MRTLLATAAIILSITTAQAQEPATRSVPPQSAIDQATQDLVNKLKATGELKRDVKPAEAKQVEAAPAEAKPAEAKAIEAKPVEAAKPVETKQVETKAVETKPVQAVTEAKPEKKRVVRKRESGEQTARRIAAKYGVDLKD